MLEREEMRTVDRLVETLALASVGGSTQKVYWSKWQSWCRMRAIEGKSPWVAEKDGVDAAVKSLTSSMALRCFAFKNQSQTIQGYLVAIELFNKMFAEWKLPPSHCMVLAVGKGIDRAHGNSDVRPRFRMPLMWSMLIEAMDRVIEVGSEGSVM